MARGSKPGERRPGAGRPKGSKNKATKELKDLCRQYTDEAVKELARLARKAESEQARVSAIRELLDRGHGKPTQVVAGDADNGPIRVVWGGEE